MQYRLQPEDYWMKTVRVACTYGLHEKTDFMNRSVGKLFLPLSRCGKRATETRRRSKISNRDLSSNTETVHEHLQ